MNVDIIKSVLFGVAIGDALGVPVEFESRIYLDKNPVKGMQSGGTYNMPAGTFSDDSSLTFCLAEALTEKFDIQTIAANFIKWYDAAWWTAHYEVFDVGIATQKAIQRLKDGIQPLEAGGESELDNGNGSLMRIAALLFYIHELPTNVRFRMIKEVSSITHQHIRSVLSCFYYLEFMRNILLGNSKKQAFRLTVDEFLSFTSLLQINAREIANFERLCNLQFSATPRNEIKSSGYVIYTLEAAIWCFMNSDTYAGTVLKAVNLGEDTDTTAAVAGGLAGLAYGISNIPTEWMNQLARKNDIENLAERLGQKMTSISF